jgi:hypothetical protein
MFKRAHRFVQEQSPSNGAICAGSLAMITMVIDSASRTHCVQHEYIADMANAVPCSNFILPNQ